MGQFWLILGRRVSHFGPRDGRFSPILAILGAPRRPISVKLGTPTRPILVDTGRQKRSISVKIQKCHIRNAEEVSKPTLKQQ